MDGPSLQERFAPEGKCFGCGPATSTDLRIRSFEADDGSVVAEWQARPEHEAFDGYVNGGILGHADRLPLQLDGDRRAAWPPAGHRDAPSTVTAEFSVRFRRPTPSDRPLRLVGRPVEVAPDRVTVETTVEVDGIMTARGRAVFVPVGEGHPAYGRW